MKPIKYLKDKGIKHSLKVLYQYKIDLIIQRVLGVFLKDVPLQDIIMIESHNDFDCNGGAFYEYLLRNGYNKKYKIVWLLKNPSLKPDSLPQNVECVPLFKPSFKKDYFVWVAKFFTFDNTVISKRRKEQKAFYLSHGAGGLKATKGKLFVPDSIDYILLQSESYAPIQANQWSIRYPSKKILTIGYPAHDILTIPHKREIEKIADGKFKKVILWMPTFRKGIDNRNDSMVEQPLGIPLINCIGEYKELNDCLQKNDSLLIIKIHPMQNLKGLGIKTTSNIKVLTGKDVKRMDVDNYRLMSAVDALISDYSGAAYEFLQVNKPISYVLHDMEEYRLGFVIDDLDELIAGTKIFSINDLKVFIEDVVNDIDGYAEKRMKVRNFIYKYNDTHNCERLAESMQL